MLPLGRRRRQASERQPALDRQLQQLIDDHATAVFHLALGVLHDRGLAEDAVQETMIKAWRSAETFRGESSQRTWILRIAHNTAIDALRRRRDQLVAPAEMPEVTGRPGDDPALRASGRHDLVVLRRALDQLDELSRSIVVLREVEGLTYDQIAETLELPIATVKTRLLRARRALRAAVHTDPEDHR